MAGARFLRWTETLLWWSGALLLGWCATTVAEARIYQVFAGRSLDRMRHARLAGRVSRSPASSARRGSGSGTQRDPGPGDQQEPAPPPGGLLGRLEVPRLGLSVIVLEGDDSRALNLGLGHIPGTPLPWANGNSALAGHRDTFLRPLRAIRD